jgi:hypothetical protein
VPIYTDADADISIGATPSSAIELDPAATIVGPISGTTGAVSAITGGFDMAFGLFSFHVDGNGVTKLISIGDSAPPAMTPGTPPVTGGNPSATAPLVPSAPLEEEPRLEELTPLVGSKGFRSRERIGDLANSTVIRRKQKNTGVYPGSAPLVG